MYKKKKKKKKSINSFGHQYKKYLKDLRTRAFWIELNAKLYILCVGGEHTNNLKIEGSVTIMHRAFNNL